jgi:hypothetical protein
MNSIITNQKALIAMLAAAYITASSADEFRLVPPPVVRDAVAVEIDSTDGAVISGRVINRSGKLIKDPRMTISYNWAWVNEFKPGKDSPGWVDSLVVPGELRPDEGAEFSFDPGRPLPQRADGYIVPSVVVTGFTIFD